MPAIDRSLILIAGEYCKEMAKRWRRDDDLDDVIVNLNNMATSGVYMMRLKVRFCSKNDAFSFKMMNYPVKLMNFMRLKEEILQNAEQLEEKDRAQLGKCDLFCI